MENLKRKRVPTCHLTMLEKINITDDMRRAIIDLDKRLGRKECDSEGVFESILTIVKEHAEMESRIAILEDRMHMVMEYFENYDECCSWELEPPRKKTKIK